MRLEFCFRFYPRGKVRGGEGLSVTERCDVETGKVTLLVV